jgi:hypothetical protein
MRPNLRASIKMPRRESIPAERRRRASLPSGS